MNDKTECRGDYGSERLHFYDMTHHGQIDADRLLRERRLIKSTRLIPVLAAAAVLLLGGLSPAVAERPFKTDDPWLVGPTRWETFGGVSVGSGSWNGISGRTLVDFNLGFEYGITHHGEIGISASPWIINNPGAEGPGDALVHYKHRMAEATPSWPDMALDVSLKLPTASRSRGIGTGKSGYGLAWLLGWREEKFTTSARLGYYRSLALRESGRFELGVAMRYRAAPQILFLGELYGDSNETIGRAGRREASAGIAYEATSMTTLDFLITAGLSHSVPDVGIRFGVRSHL